MRTKIEKIARIGVKQKKMKIDAVTDIYSKRRNKFTTEILADM